MYPNIRFTSTHFRSYLISRFNYNRSGDLVAVEGCKVVSLIQPAHYDYAASVWFLVSGVWPHFFRFARKVRGSREGGALVGLSLRFIKNLWPFFGLGFVWRCSTFYFPLLDGTDPRSASLGLVTHFEDNTSTYSTTYLAEIFPELDFILGRSYSVLRAVTKSWVYNFTWITSGAKTRTEHLTAVRSLGYPAFCY